MITENLSTLKIHKLTKKQYERERDAGRLDPNAIYLTPDEADAGSSGGGAQSDWNAAEGEPGHVLNRTHYSEFVYPTLVDGEFTSQYMSVYGFFAIEAYYSEEIEMPEKVTLVYDGVEYKDLTITRIDALGANFAGNLFYLNSLVGTSFENTGEPFLATIGPSGCGVFTLDTEPTQHTVVVIVQQEVVHKIPEKFIPAIPFFDLSEMGLPQIPSTGYVECDANAYAGDMDRLCAALENGIVKIKFNTVFNNNTTAIVLAGYNNLCYHINYFAYPKISVHISVYNYLSTNEGPVRKIRAEIISIPEE